MVLIVCLDDNNGMAFNNRRQSRDAAIINDMVQYVAPNAISVEPYSAELFSNYPVVVEDMLTDKNGVRFVERDMISECDFVIDKLIVYRWNRRYPSDLLFPFEKTVTNMILQERMDFAGSSHDRITREVYVL